MMSGVRVPSLVTLPEPEVLRNLLLLMMELGGPWWLMFSELLEVPAEVVLLGGTVVVVISEPMLVRPDSELADQFPLDE